MTSIQIDLAFFVIIILINIIITYLYRQFERLKSNKNDISPFANRTSIESVVPSSFMPRVPFLIINNIEPSSRKIVYFHNILSLINYAIFIYLIFIHNWVINFVAHSDNFIIFA